MPLLHHAGWLLLALTAGVQASETTTIRLNTSLEAPYQVVVDGQLSGSSVDVLQCIFKRLQQPYQIQLPPAPPNKARNPSKPRVSGTI